jgi:purine-binding chemotaxis protein CheW
MTDEEEDGRMDRAKRIKRMREGGRGIGDDESESDEESERPSDDGTADETSTDEPSDTETEPTGTETDTDSESEPAESKQDTEETVDGEDVVPESVEVESAETPDLEPDEDSISAPLPETEQLEEALEESDAEAETESVAPEVAKAATEAAESATGAGELLDGESTYDEETRVLEFTLDDEHYCLDIEYIEEIVKEETITRVPNTPERVEGVVDLRGQITTILNPKVTIGKDDRSPGDLIVVFDSDAFEDQGHVGWVVDDVRQVSPITDSEVNEAPVEDEHINGVIDRDDEEFVIWTSPELAMEAAE